MTSFLRVRKEEKEEEKREAEHSLLFLGAQREEKDESKIWFTSEQLTSLTEVLIGQQNFLFSKISEKRGKDNLLFSKAADFPFEVFILKF